jgi:CRISPR/Cas system endoribonuclease Cas6 (RAMP superfamily)
MWENQSRIEQAFSFQSVDVQNTKAIQSQVTPKRNAVFYTLSPVVLW